jgi:glutathione S-transferase
MSDQLTLYVCHINEGGPKPHACRRAIEALREGGHDFEKIVYGKGIPFGLFTKGKRPDLKEMSGQEKLPVLKLTDGSTINGGTNIVEWAKAHAQKAPAPAPTG